MVKIGYQLYKNEDMDEGRGKPVPIPGIFYNRGAAEIAAIGRGVYGQVADIQEVPLFETPEEFETWTMEQDPDYREYMRLRAKFESR